MFEDRENKYRPILEDDPPAFFDRVNTPWDHVPDLEEYNQHAYRRIVRALNGLKRTQGTIAEANSQGLLILGEAGTGKTHLLMRVARNLSASNHILFVRKPNNEDAVAQHVWTEIVNSLAKSMPTSGVKRSQLDDLLAHVFTAVLIPEFEQDVLDGKDADQKRRWADRLKADPYNLFTMLGDGEKRQNNMDMLRRRTLRYLQQKHPEVDQQIARVLITYCFVAREDLKRMLLTWLSGQDVDPQEAKVLGLPSAWVQVDETSSDTSIQQQREEQALRAVRTVGILSTYYQPLILAFDQLEGLRGNERLTQRWGDTVREIFTMTPNLLILTCIFPSLWEEWFKATFGKHDRSVSERIAQQVITLESFSSQHGLKLLATHLEPFFVRHHLPSNIFPFTDEDVQTICEQATSPRKFLQAAHGLFEEWLDGKFVTAKPTASAPVVVTQDAIDSLIRSTMIEFENDQREGYLTQIPVEQDSFGRVRNILETILSFSDDRITYSRATCGNKVMPPNVIVRSSREPTPFCIAVSYAEGNSLAACARNLLAVVKEGTQTQRAILLRDQRCKAAGKATAEYLAEFERLGGIYMQAGADELAVINAIYDTLVAVEEHDLSIGTHQVDKRQFVQFLRTGGSARRSHLLRSAANQFPPLDRLLALGTAPSATSSTPAVTTAANSQPTKAVTPEKQSVPSKQPAPLATKPIQSNVKQASPTPQNTPPTPPPGLAVDVVIGSKDETCSQLGLLGTLKHDGRRVAVSFSKPMCAVVLGYMGSGKSYALGVLMENALLQVPNITANDRPMAVVAFNYRRNPDARFEYAGFTQPNRKNAEVDRLQKQYQAHTAGIKPLNVLGYGQELSRRQEEYRGLTTLPILFRAKELRAEHWEILMKPPSAQAEYMDVVRDLIRKLFYADRLSFKTLETAILTDERLMDSQRRRAMNRFSFAQQWLSDDRPYEWSDLLAPGTLNVFDLRMQTMTSEDALKLCLVITDLVRRTKNGVNKMVVFDEAHEYVDSKALVGELENAITQIRHDGLSFVLASQFPEKIPERIFKYLLTRLIFKLPNQKAINTVRKAAPNLASMSPQQVANLGLEEGVCLIQTDDDCTDTLLKVPQMLTVRPRCSQHGGETLRNLAQPKS
jgi:hypothetical protein